MKPKTITLELTEEEIAAVVQEWATREYPNATVAKVTLHSHPHLYDDDRTTVLEWAMEASVRITAKEG